MKKTQQMHYQAMRVIASRNERKIPFLFITITN